MSRQNLILSIAALLFVLQLFGCTDKETLPKISIEKLTVTEGNVKKIVPLKISISEVSKDDISIVMSSRERTALGEKDFVVFQNLMTSIPAGSLETTIDLEIIGDDVFEQDEFFFVLFEQVTGAEPVEKIVQVDIIDDDPDPNSFIDGPFSPESYPGMQLLWRDEFNATALNAGNWTQEFGDNWFNNELQSYTDEGRNVWTRDGNLVIEAREEASPYGGTNPYTSARIITQDKFEFQYGRVDIRAAMPEGKGLWPALWMLGANIDEVGWPKCGEIDILEMIGAKENIANNAIHWQGEVEKQSEDFAFTIPSGSLHGEFHVYSIVWTQESITFLIDDIQRDVIDIQAAHMSEFHDPHFFIMNVAVGGDWPGSPDNTTVFPQQMIVDYIRVFQ